VIGLILLIMGYHMIVWSLPNTPSLHLPRDRWYLLVAGSATLILLSMGIDRLERRNMGDPPKRDDG